MIIKKKRVRARGQALKRFIRHVRDGEDNDAIEVLRGNFADLEDARADALRFCREYAIRAWSISPERKLTDAQIEDMINRMAREFGFDPQNCVLIRHTKPRAFEGNPDDDARNVPTDEHYHLLVAEVNPLDGGVLSNAHDYARHEKLSLAMEVAWGHRVIPGPHIIPAVTILAQEAPAVANELSTVAPTDHPAAFDERDHQRLKRAGIDLPSIRAKISDALAHASDRANFDARMFAIGLRVCPGKKAGILVVETTSDSVFIGSLARLTRLRQQALDQRMKFNGPSQKAEVHDPRSDVRAVETSYGSIGAGIAIDGRKLGDGGLSADARHPDRSAAPDSGGDRTFAREDRRPREQVGRSGSCESFEKRYPQLRLAFGLDAHKGVLLDMLGIARRSALPLLERADLNLLDVIEEETATIRHLETPCEPATLIAARKSFDADTLALQAIEAKIDAARQTRDSLAPLSAWDRMFGSAQKLARQNADKWLLRLEHRGAEARDRRAASSRLLTAEVKKFESAKAGAEADIFKRVAAGRSRIETARVGRKLLENNPHFARWSAIAVLRLAAIIQRNRSEMREEQHDEWDLVPSYDIWGIPILPRPKSP